MNVQGSVKMMVEKMVLDDKEWKKKLTKEQFDVLRKKGTEQAFTGEFWDNHEAGVYYCAGCGSALFTSDEKFDSGTGWPSFMEPVEGAVETSLDTSHGMRRTEVHCAKCGGHLGHLFDDGPDAAKDNCRYCINSVSLAFKNEALIHEEPTE